MKRDRIEELASENAWYSDDQICVQQASLGSRLALQQRQRLTLEMIAQGIRPRIHSTRTTYLLDAGCGDGLLLSHLSSKKAELLGRDSNQTVLIGVDYNHIRLERALAKRAGAVSQADLMNLPFADATFDAVCCSHVLEHVPDTRAALSELRRVLKDDGTLVIVVPNEGCLLAQIRNRFLQRSILRTTDHLTFFTQKTLEELVHQSGFERFGPIRHEGFFFPHLRLSTFFRESRLGRVIALILRKTFPSQAAGLFISLRKTALFSSESDGHRKA
jgi:ubiquinone/menaquinone biosynthesis C-methylase UbiE